MSRERGVKGERWIVLHDGMPDHPKVEDLSDRAFRTLVRLWCWCGRHLTDGHVTAAVWKKITTPTVRRELLEAGLVDAYRDGSFVMHDYLDWQRSADEVNAALETKRSAGRMGNHTRWHVKEGRPDPSCELCQADAAAASDPSQAGSHQRSTVRREPQLLAGTSDDADDVVVTTNDPADSHPDEDAEPVPTSDDTTNGASHQRSHLGSRTDRRDRDRDRGSTSSGDLASNVAESNVVELHGPLRSPATAETLRCAPHFLATDQPLPDLAGGPDPTRSVDATTGRARGTSAR